MFRPLKVHLILYFPSRLSFFVLTRLSIHSEGLCNCSTGGEGIVEPEECDLGTGQCLCLPGYTGLQCEDCEEGYFTNGTSGCLPCSCDSFGAVDNLCDRSGYIWDVVNFFAVFDWKVLIIILDENTEFWLVDLQKDHISSQSVNLVDQNGAKRKVSTGLKADVVVC